MTTIQPPPSLRQRRTTSSTAASSSTSVYVVACVFVHAVHMCAHICNIYDVMKIKVETHMYDVVAVCAGTQDALLAPPLSLSRLFELVLQNVPAIF